MRIRRTLPIVLAVVVIAAAVTLAVALRKHAPPEPARLLPGGDAFFYFDLGAARKANLGKDLPPVSHAPEYEQFIRETGFQFERDLDEAAIAFHYPANWPGGGTGGSNPDVRSSVVMVGKFHGERVAAYLRQIAQSVENYRSVDIFTILVEGRSLRVAVLSADSVAEQRVFEWLLPAIACLFVFASIPRQMKNFLVSGLVFLAIGIYRLQQEVFPNRAWWPIMLLLTGLGLMLAAANYAALRVALGRVWKRPVN